MLKQERLNVVPLIGKGGLTINGGEFQRNGRPFVIVGANYLSSTSGIRRKIWNDYNSEAVDRKLDELRQVGVNCLRVIFSWDDYVSPRRGRINPTPVARLTDFLKRCAARDMLVQLIVGGVPAWVKVYLGDEEWGDFRPSDIYVNPRYLELQAEYLVGLIKHGQLMTRSALTSYDLVNEPVWVDALNEDRWAASVNAKAASKAWSEWLVDLGGSEDTPAPTLNDFMNGGSEHSIGLLYKRFISDMINLHTKTMRDALRSMDSFAFVTVTRNHSRPDLLGLDQDMKLYWDHIDYLSINTDLPAENEATTGDPPVINETKPVVIYNLK